jgi:DNA (cytosine-5)-methyltransferase 1
MMSVTPYPVSLRSGTEERMLKVLDLFSCVGCHAEGLHDAGPFVTVQFVESNPRRRAELAAVFPGVPVHDDVRTFTAPRGFADVVVGGPPCQRTSVAAAIHGYRNGESLWPDMLRIGDDVGAEWVVVEQPPGNKAWEAEVADDLRRSGRHVARVEFGACDLGAPYPRRRVFILACASLPRLEIAWSAVPSAIERVKRAADARGAWNPDQLATLPVDARSAGEMDGGPRSRERRERIEALGDSNPPAMMEVIGRAILAAEASSGALQATGAAA